ncbi:IS66-like element accessory protein TnpA [Pseudomonas oryzihabitans]|uniref:Transposase n=1 Tax=Pseudomonas oryzihabitans TaxID=47885 RepID=A0A1G5PGI1_9PSED|nr:transposase [Pseudomonas psychrotolerans]SCZ48617.1 Transposase [Pseudomonas psychrotolerans]
MPGQRRSYPKSFKAQIVEECTQPGALVAGVALSHGLNANLVHKWIRRQQAQQPAVPSGFIPIPLGPSGSATPSAADRAIQIAIPHRTGKLSVQRPGNDPEGCARFLRELLK